MESRKKEIEKELSNLLALQQELQEITHMETVERNKKLIGNCYKYRNCYSCPKDESDYWYIYAKVLRVDDEGSLISLCFDVDVHGKAEIEEDWHYSNGIARGRDGWEQISDDEFEVALCRFKSHIASLIQSATH